MTGWVALLQRAQSPNLELHNSVINNKVIICDILLVLLKRVHSLYQQIYVRWVVGSVINCWTEKSSTKKNVYDIQSVSSVFQCFRLLSVHWAMLILTTIVALQNSTGLLDFNKNSFTEFINRLAIILFFYISIIHKKNYCYESSTQHVEYNYKWSINISTFIAKHYSMGLYIRKGLITSLEDWNKRHLLINR
jgi:hypothetical protein